MVFPSLLLRDPSPREVKPRGRQNSFKFICYTRCKFTVLRSLIITLQANEFLRAQLAIILPAGPRWCGPSRYNRRWSITKVPLQAGGADPSITNGTAASRDWHIESKSHLFTDIPRVWLARSATLWWASSLARTKRIMKWVSISRDRWEGWTELKEHYYQTWEDKMWLAELDWDCDWRWRIVFVRVVLASMEWQRAK